MHTHGKSTASAKQLIGAHVAGGKDLARALAAVETLKLDVAQVFLSAPKNYHFPAYSQARDEATRARLEELQVPLYAHAPYLINFGSSREDVRKASAELLSKTLARAAGLGIKGVVMHAGSSTGDGLEVGLARTREGLLPILDTLPADGPRVLLEPMAGQANSLASSVASLPAFFAAVDSHPMLGLCLDTAHLLAAGEPLDEEGGATRLLANIEATVGLDRVGLVHTNDSKTGRGSHRDLHANHGFGKLSPTVLPELLASSLRAPWVLETPGAAFLSDLALLRSHRAAATQGVL